MNPAVPKVMLAIALVVLGSAICAGPVPCLQNHPPIANAGGPYVVCDEDGGTLDGSQSFDADAPADNIVSYAWDLNNDGTADLIVETSQVSLSWSELNVLMGALLIGQTYPIKLRVEDSFEEWSDWSESTLRVEECAMSAVPRSWGAIKAFFR